MMSSGTLQTASYAVWSGEGAIATGQRFISAGTELGDGPRARGRRRRERAEGVIAERRRGKLSPCEYGGGLPVSESSQSSEYTIKVHDVN